MGQRACGVLMLEVDPVTAESSGSKTGIKQSIISQSRSVPAGFVNRDDNVFTER